MSDVDAPQLRILPEETETGPFYPSATNAYEVAMALQPEAQPLQSDASGELGTAPAETEAYDPSTETIDGVLAYVDKNPDQRDSVLEAERSGKNRTTLINQLESR